MIVFVLGSMVLGLAAGGFALLSGTSLMMAVALYSGTGVFAMMMVLLRVYLCQWISQSGIPLNTVEITDRARAQDGIRANLKRNFYRQ